MIDLDQLSAFIAIAEFGTVTQAARKLHRTQSAISRRLGLLEDALGAPLFERRGTRLALTDCGRAFLPYAERAMATVSSGREAVRDQLAPNAGSVTVAIVGTLVEAPLAQALSGLPRSGLDLSVLTASSAEVSRLVRNGDANLGVRYFDDDHRELQCEQLGSERFCVVAADGCQVNEHTPWIGFPRTRNSKADLGRLLAQQLIAAGRASARLMAVDSMSAQKRLVEAGLGVAWLPESSVREELQHGRLIKLDVPRLAITIRIHLVYRREGYLSPASQSMIALLKRAFRDQTSAAAGDASR